MGPAVQDMIDGAQIDSNQNTYDPTVKIMQTF